MEPFLKVATRIGDIAARNATHVIIGCVFTLTEEVATLSDLGLILHDLDPILQSRKFIQTHSLLSVPSDQSVEILLAYIEIPPINVGQG